MIGDTEPKYQINLVCEYVWPWLLGYWFLRGTQWLLREMGWSEDEEQKPITEEESREEQKDQINQVCVCWILAFGNLGTVQKTRSRNRLQWR